VGGGTWRNDQPRLDVRLPGLEHRSPDRFVLTGGLAPAETQSLPNPQAISELSDVQYLYVEGGAIAARAFLDAGLVDALHIYTAPITIGEGVRAPVELQPESLAADSSPWRIAEQRRLGSDTFAAYQRTKA
jgi:diaminohydroxyphosphoribosylaminopyrimidine deaminase/5-amino-6-(5-phosphoribosylamino)uracil reductase